MKFFLMNFCNDVEIIVCTYLLNTYLSHTYLILTFYSLYLPLSFLCFLICFFNSLLKSSNTYLFYTYLLKWDRLSFCKGCSPSLVIILELTEEFKIYQVSN